MVSANSCTYTQELSERVLLAQTKAIPDTVVIIYAIDNRVPVPRNVP